MVQAGFMWECSCGHTEYCEEEPEECLKCGNISAFMKMPEEIVEEREKELVEESIKPQRLVKAIKLKLNSAKSLKLTKVKSMRRK